MCKTGNEIVWDVLCNEVKVRRSSILHNGWCN
jgi:hypothetical protein